jgi:membrane protease YdiL (CAAX protease family)
LKNHFPTTGKMMEHLSGDTLDEEIAQAEASPLATPQPPKHGVHWIFFGAEGLRAGWGVLLFVLLFIGFGFLTAQVLRHLLPHSHRSALLPLRLAFISEVAQMVPLLLATAIMALIERRSLLSYGYQGPARAMRFISGLVWGFAALSALVLVLWKSGLLAFDGVQLHGADIWEYALGWGVLFVIVAVFEESTLRGYLQFTLTRGIGFWWGALLLSSLFGFSHGTNPGETPVGLFGAAAVGLVFCLSLWYTGSLWWALGCHASWDWAESYFYGTSDSGLMSQGHLFGEHPTGPRLWSGGTTGPEGSLLVLALLAIMALGMWLWWGRRVQSPFSGSGWRPAWIKASHRKPAETLPTL